MICQDEQIIPSVRTSRNGSSCSLSGLDSGIWRRCRQASREWLFFEPWEQRLLVWHLRHSLGDEQNTGLLLPSPSSLWLYHPSTGSKVKRDHAQPWGHEREQHSSGECSLQFHASMACWQCPLMFVQLTMMDLHILKWSTKKNSDESSVLFLPPPANCTCLGRKEGRIWGHTG